MTEVRITFAICSSHLWEQGYLQILEVSQNKDK